MSEPTSVRVSFRISTRLHALMRELTKRYRRARGMKIGGFYYDALNGWIERQNVPKRSEVIERGRVDLVAPPDMARIVDELTRIAAFRKVDPAKLIEEAVEEFLEEDRNYLDSDVYRKHRRKWRHYR